MESRDSQHTGLTQEMEALELSYVIASRSISADESAKKEETSLVNGDFEYHGGDPMQIDEDGINKKFVVREKLISRLTEGSGCY